MTCPLNFFANSIDNFVFAVAVERIIATIDIRRNIFNSCETTSLETKLAAMNQAETQIKQMDIVSDTRVKCEFVGTCMPLGLTVTFSSENAH